MKVVLFCGGLGTRLREHSETIPKPMVAIGERPILWHLMKYYAHFGHTDFILCLGYRGEQIRRYFAEYRDPLKEAGSDVADWTITCVDTGVEASIGERLVAVREHLVGEACFLANYSDGLADLPLDVCLERFRREGCVASLACVRPQHSFHTVTPGDDGLVAAMHAARDSGVWVNGGFFALRQEIFDYIGAGEDLVAAPFARLIAARQLMAYRHEGFWAAMDTFKDKRAFDDMEARGETPWKVWRGR
ncbi:MAG: glucose-1-phosphate cytidylyltransferase [Burkholderiales bacterium]|nr:glucose-1-phosphate cytidylyltransferase [Burkholderiales bacterium]